MNEETWKTLCEAAESQTSAKGSLGKDMPVFLVEKEKLLDLCKLLCRDERFEFTHCSGVTAVDDFPDEPRFTVVYHLYSYKLASRLRIKCSVEESTACVPSTISIWPGIAIHERESFDMFGIRFEGHPNLKRILMPENYPHHPLRKDFPLEGIEPERLFREWDRGRGNS